MVWNCGVCIDSEVAGNAPGMLEAGEEKASADKGLFFLSIGLRWGVIGAWRRSLGSFGGGIGGDGAGIEVPSVNGAEVGIGAICGARRLDESTDTRELMDRASSDDRRSEDMAAMKMVVLIGTA